ncbi:LamB/YcsF family protein [Campylobacter hepaticus]
MTGNDISIDFDSICIHSDTPGALSLIKETKDILKKNNIQVKPPQFNF